MKFFATDIKDKNTFNFEGSTLTMIKDYSDGFYLYERRFQDNGHLMGYELVRGVKHKNPDGNIVYTYPSSKQFGLYGWFYPARFDMETLEKKHQEKKSRFQSKSKEQANPQEA